MFLTNDPQLSELEKAQRKLVSLIYEAEGNFKAESNGHELLTAKAALRSIEDAIKSMRAQSSIYSVPRLGD